MRAAPVAGRAGVEEAWARAAAAAGAHERRIRLAGSVVCLRSAGEAMLARLGTAFAHLADDSAGEPELTVFLWDSDAGDGAPALPDVGPGHPRGAVFYTADEPVQSAYQPGLGQLSMLDVEAGSAWFWCRSAAELPFWEPAAPLRQILHWWLADRGMMLLHGAAVGRAGGGVLLVGRGGSGKSTCALSALTSTLLYAGDDYVAVEAEPRPWVHSLYSSGKLDPGHARLLPHLPPPSYAGDGGPDEKAVFYVHERYPERMSRGFPLRAVLVPRVRGEHVRLAPANPSEALRALAPSTLLQLHPGRPEALAGMARLLERVPAYSLEVGGPVGTIPEAIGGLLEELAR